MVDLHTKQFVVSNIAVLNINEPFPRSRPPFGNRLHLGWHSEHVAIRHDEGIGCFSKNDATAREFTSGHDMEGASNTRCWVDGFENPRKRGMGFGRGGAVDG